MHINYTDINSKQNYLKKKLSDKILSWKLQIFLNIVYLQNCTDFSLFAVVLKI